MTHASRGVELSAYTTLGLGGPARDFVSADTEDDLIDAIAAADSGGAPVLLIGGGSNLVISDDGFRGTVVHVNTQGLMYVDVGDGIVDVTVAAGADWDHVVASTIAQGLAGLEPLSGIPGRAGATPIQNVGAYGREVSEIIRQVRVYDRQDGQVKTIPNAFCQFAYRTSFFKSGRPESLLSRPGTPPHAAGQPRYVVLDVTFRLARQPLSVRIRYAELAAELGLELGEQGLLSEVRAAVIAIRSRKGMVVRPDDPDTHSAGSFFTNPVVSPEDFAAIEKIALERGAAPVPHFAVPSETGLDGMIKVPAAWLIEHSGFAKGYGAPAPARVSSKHTLALVNTGGATTSGLLNVAREIVAGVHQAYGVTLTPEAILVGVTL